MLSYTRIILYLTLALILSPLFIASVTDIPRHVDLSKVSEERLPSILLNIYTDIVRLISVEDFGKAIGRIAESYAIYIPSDLRYIYSRFNELLDTVARRLNETYIILSLMEDRVRIGDRSRAIEMIDDGFRSVWQANVTYRELYIAAVEVSRRIGLPIYRSIEGLEDRIGYYYDRLRSILSSIEDLPEAKPTSITLILSSSEAWVGSTVRVTGMLSVKDGGLLPDRELEIRIAGYSYTVRTGSTGLFTYDLMVPYVYVDEVYVYASYYPRGSDVGLYLPSRSNVERLRILYLKPILELYVDDSLLEPTDTFKVYGRIDPSDIGVYVEFLSKRIEPMIYADGRFELKLSIPSGIDEGVYRIVARSKPMDIYGPTSAYVEVRVSRRPIDLEFTVPSMVLAGSTVRVMGKLTYGGIPVGAYVDISSIWASTSIYADGGFEIDLHIPLTMLTGSYSIELSIHPYDPRYRSLSTRVELYVVNPLTLPIPLAFVSVILAYIASSYVKHRAGIHVIAKSKPIIEKPVAEGGLEEARIGIVDVYLKAVEVVEAYTGVEAKPSYTAREYLCMVSGMLGDALDLFKRITLLHELRVYGGLEIDLGEAYMILDRLRSLIGGGGFG